MKYKLILTVTAITVFYVANTIYWQDDLASYTTSQYTMACAEELPSIYNIVKEINAWDYFTGINTFDYPPLYYITASIVILIFGKHWYFMNLVNNTFYLLILLIFSYLLGKEIQDKETGLISLVVVALYPLTYELYGLFSMDFALMGAITMSIYFFHKTNFFKSLRWSIIFGMSCGFGMMIKDPFGAFVIGPILYGLFEVIKNSNKDKKPLINFLLFCAVFYIVIYPFYFMGPFQINKVMFKRIVEESPNIPWYSFKNLRFFTAGLWERQLSPPFFVAFVVGIYYFVRNARNTSKFILLLWVIIPNSVILFMPHWKTSRYLMPHLPALAIVSAFWIRNIERQRYRKVVLAVLIIIGAIQYYEFTNGMIWKKFNYNKFVFDYYTGSDVFDQSLDYEREVTSLSFNAIERTLRKKIEETNRNDSSEKKYYIFNPFTLDSFPIDQFLNGFFWYKDMNVEMKNFRIADNISMISHVCNDLDNIDFILHIATDIDLKNPAYFNAMKKRYLKFPWREKETYDVSEAEWIWYENMWNRIISSFLYEEIIYRVELHEKNFTIYIYSKK